MTLADVLREEARAARQLAAISDGLEAVDQAEREALAGASEAVERLRAMLAALVGTVAEWGKA